MAEIENATDFKTQQLPLARIKKIMKSDEDVRMISAEAPVLFAKACELFILELTHRSWQSTSDCKRRTLQRNDVATSIAQTDILDFLVDIVPREEPKPPAAAPGAKPAAVGVPAQPQPGVPAVDQAQQVAQPQVEAQPLPPVEAPAAKAEPQ